LAGVGSLAVVLLAPPFAALIAMQLVINLSANVSGNSQQNMPAAMYNGDREKIKKFFSNEQFILEIAGIGIPYFLGSIIGVLGTMGTMYLYPVTAVAGALIILALVR